MKTPAAPLLALALALALPACGERPQANEPGTDTALGNKVREATDAARRKLAEGNISISKHSGAKVEIAPDGSLLINGDTIPLDASQRDLTLRYRGQVIAVADAGIQIGVQGAHLGVRAAGEAIKGVFTGNPGQIEQRINAEAEQLKAGAAKICDQLPALLATQQQLAAAVPAFKPYATMDQGSIDTCRDGKVELP